MGIVAAAIVLAAPAPGQSAAAPTGLHGFVRRGPIMPVCFENVPCDGPAAGVKLTFTQADGRKVQTVTRKTGFYRVLLSPGRYVVTADLPRPEAFYTRSTRVLDGRDGRVDFTIDTGIQ